MWLYWLGAPLLFLADAFTIFVVPILILVIGIRACRLTLKFAGNSPWPELYGGLVFAPFVLWWLLYMTMHTGMGNILELASVSVAMLLIFEGWGFSLRRFNAKAFVRNPAFPSVLLLCFVLALRITTPYIGK